MDMRNVLSFRIPGVDQTFFVKFPGSRLPVCDACKRLFKTREVCRLRQKHTAEPWTPVYICLTLDASCTTTTDTTDGDNTAQQHGRRGTLVDKPFVCRPAQSRTFCAPPSFFAQKDQPPVCTTCKKANRAKKTCRGRYTHGQLPWSTVYVTLSTAESVDPKTILAPPSESLTETVPLLYPSSSGGGVVVSDNNPSLPSPSHDEWNGTSPNPASARVESPSKDDATAIVSKVSLESPPSAQSEGAAGVAAVDGHNKTMPSPTTRTGDPIYPIPVTRTMLLSVSSQSTTLTWVEPRQNSHSTKDIPLKSLPASAAPGTRHRAAMNVDDSIQSPPSYQPFPLVPTTDASTLPLGDIFMGSYDQYGSVLRQPDYTAQQLQQHQQPYSFVAYEEDIHRYGHQVPLPHMLSTMPPSTIPNANATVTAGEAAAAANQQRISGTVGEESHQTDPALFDRSRPIPILPQPQNPPGTHLGYFAPPPGLNFPGALNFQNQTAPPDFQMHPYPNHNSGFYMNAPNAPSVDFHSGEGMYQQSFGMAQHLGYTPSAGVIDTSVSQNSNVTYGTCDIAPAPSVPGIGDQTSGTIPENEKKAKSIRETESSLGDDRMQKRHRAA